MNPNETLVVGLLIVLLLVIHLTPIIWVLVSGRSHGGAKFGWFLLTFFFSWLALAVFLIVTKAPNDDGSEMGD
jgi:uncharacterized membrane protein